jgi:hypothetical protein
MTSTTLTDEQRRLIRQQIHTQRSELVDMLDLVLPAEHDVYPRSLIMRMLTGKSTLLMIFLVDVLPLLLRCYMDRHSHREKE